MRSAIKLESSRDISFRLLLSTCRRFARARRTASRLRSWLIISATGPEGRHCQDGINGKPGVATMIRGDAIRTDIIRNGDALRRMRRLHAEKSPGNINRMSIVDLT